MEENQKEIPFKCPKCNNEFSMSVNEAICTKCGADLKAMELVHILYREVDEVGVHSTTYKSRFARGGKFHIFDITHLQEPVDNEAQAEREESIRCSYCEKDVKVIVRPPFELSKKTKITAKIIGWFLITANSIFGILLLFSTKIRLSIGGLLAWGLLYIPGILILARARAERVYPSFVKIPDAEKRHFLIPPGAEIEGTE